MEQEKKLQALFRISRNLFKDYFVAADRRELFLESFKNHSRIHPLKLFKAYYIVQFRRYFKRNCFKNSICTSYGLIFGSDNTWISRKIYVAKEIIRIILFCCLEKHLSFKFYFSIGKNA